MSSQLNNYNIQLVKGISTKKMGDRRHINFHRKDKKMITLDEIDKVYSQLLDKFKLQPEDVAIVGLNIEHPTTLKGFGDNDFTDYFDEDYLSGKPEEVKEKLTEFFNVNFIFKNIKKN